MDKPKCACSGKCHRPAKPETQKHLRNHLRSIFKFGIEGLKVLTENPAADSEPIVVPKSEPVVLPPDFLPALLAEARDWMRGIFAVAIYTGARKAEVLRIQVANVHIEERYIILRAPKTNNWRRVAIPEGLVPYLQVELRRARSELLFVNAHGKPHRADWPLAKRLRATLTRAGLVAGWDHRCRKCRTSERHPDNARRKCAACGKTLWRSPVHHHYNFKDLRSTFATVSYEETDDAKWVQTSLGHGDPRTTDRYVKMASKQLAKQARKLELVKPATHKVLTEENPPATEAAAAGVKTK